MGTLKLADELRTHYFHNAWIGPVSKCLLEHKPDKIDLTGARLTAPVLLKIWEYMEHQLDSGQTVEIIDDRPLILEYFESCKRDKEIEKISSTATPLTTPHSVEELKARLAEFSKHPDTVYKMQSSFDCADTVEAAWYILINLVYPDVQFTYEPFLSTALSSLFRDCVDKSPSMQQKLQEQDTLTVILNSGALTQVHKIDNDKYEFGALGKMSFSKIKDKHCIVPYGFGVIKIDIKDKSDTSELHELAGRCLKSVYKFAQDAEKRNKKYDLFTVLDKGSL